MGIGERIKRVLDEKNWSEGELSRRSGVNQPTIHRIIAGSSRDPRQSNIEKIAKALSTTSSFLRHGKTDKTADNSFLDDSLTILKRVPILSSVEAGNWTESVPYKEMGDDVEWVEVPGDTSDEAFALRVSGNSMTNPYGAPSLPEGSIVVIEPDPSPLNGKIVVAMLDGSNEATIKKLEIDGPKKFLVPLNPKYDPIPINGNCRIIGYAKRLVMEL